MYVVIGGRDVHILVQLSRLALLIAQGGSAEKEAQSAAGGDYVGAAGHAASTAAADTIAIAVGGSALSDASAAADYAVDSDGVRGRWPASAYRDGSPSQSSRGVRGTGAIERQTRRDIQGQRRRLPDITIGTLGNDFNVRDKGPTAGPRDQVGVCVNIFLCVCVCEVTLFIVCTRVHSIRCYCRCMVFRAHQPGSTISLRKMVVPTYEYTCPARNRAV